MSNFRNRNLAPILRQQVPRKEVPNSPSPYQNHNEASLNISNLEDRYCLKYGMEFKDLLDARDQVMEHQFDFHFDLNDILLGENILKSKLYQKIKDKIKHFLA